MDSGLCVCRVSLCPADDVHSVQRGVQRVRRPEGLKPEQKPLGSRVLAKGACQTKLWSNHPEPSESNQTANGATSPVTFRPALTSEDLPVSAHKRFRDPAAPPLVSGRIQRRRLINSPLEACRLPEQYRFLAPERRPRCASRSRRESTKSHKSEVLCRVVRSVHWEQTRHRL